MKVIIKSRIEKLLSDENGATSSKAVYIAKDNQKIIGVAGAAESSTDGGKQM